jgi:cytoskeletal protein CcmA (bactofilin family)
MFSRDTRPETRADSQRPSNPATFTPPPPRHSGPLEVVSSSSASKYESPKDRPTSILGPDISIFGQQLILKTKGSLLIQGQIEGDVHGESVTVDDGANVKGVITARIIEVLGGVKGELKGSSVILHERSIVNANIVQQKLTVAEGAQFEGSVSKAKDPREVTPDLS